ncbi:tannase/feruloyl esterase family alpha/beta hydrolase [Clostridium sp. P21]|uniref:Tannase/feruloyl esterase family alpha/beta hydrolase n=1 Tax=Clostridium muellerianum TaxID=2716538 RepID=A0A7Y0EI82_9CLOT|nr:tannase/feruloyl esterase family alpha/beta hydrolase [Clostridium muellerianum]NMM63956.1 tannase/feruloyl esterase family alpha/beta hydrolase [Clostridium muellerianum]
MKESLKSETTLNSKATFAKIHPQVETASVKNFKFPNNTAIVNVTMVSGDNVMIDGKNITLPNYCKIEGKINERVGKGPDGNAEYYIGFELSLPNEWNERLYFEGGGGSDGIIPPKMGIRKVGKIPALSRGFATVGTDGGHQGNTDCKFGYDQQARIDYGYNAINQVTIAAKSIINDYYGRSPKYSYFMGASNGGRQALAMAQRFPGYFDGIVSGAPALNLTNAGIAEMWANQIFAKISKKDKNDKPLLYTAFSETDMKLVANTILKQFDKADGLEDGIILDMDAARKFHPSTLPRKTSNSPGLSDEQINALKLLFEGPKDSQGNALYSNWPWDPGICDPEWRSWTLGTEDCPPRNVTLGVESLARVFTTPIPKEYDSKKALEWSLKYDFDNDPSKLVLSASFINNVSTYLEPFRKLGGKLILYHGMADPVFSAYDTINYYDKLIETNGGLKETQKFARLFLIPGMNHVEGGPATDQFDALTAIQNWVEQDKAPNMIVAHGSNGKPRATRCVVKSYAT